MDLNRITDVETLRELLRLQVRESERLKAELKQAYEQLRGKDEKKPSSWRSSLQKWSANMLMR